MTRKQEQEQNTIRRIMQDTAAAHPELQELTQIIIDAKLSPQQLTELAAAFRKNL